MAFLQCEKNVSDAELFRSANGHGVAGCLAGGCEIDRGWSRLSPVQHGETAVIRGATPELLDAGVVTLARLQLGCIVAQDAGALLVSELQRLHDALDRIGARRATGSLALLHLHLMLLELDRNFNHMRVRSLILGGARQ